jgi:ABC-type transport system involved in Fe-S cluster assembly fused permease/ATPase subunit
MTFINFLKLIDTSLYIEYMIHSDRYTNDDIINFDIEKYFNTDEMVIDTKEALIYFYDKFNKEMDEEHIDKIMEEYEGNSIYLFQRLYKKYIDKKFIVNESIGVYPDVIFV